jgi:flagellar biosynthetic protein FliR
MFLLQEFIPTEILPRLPGVLWTFVRIGALLVAAPMFGARTVPVRVRVMLAALLALVVFPQVNVPADVAIVSGAGAVLVVREILIGISLGFMLQLLFAAVATAGEVIALSMGLAFASVVDPERGISVPVVSQYFVVFSTLLFLALDGHLALLMLLFESFELLPPAASGLAGAGFLEIAGWVSRMFEAAILVALPAAAALLVAAISMGLIARSAPQLNIFAVGFPMTLLLGLVALTLSLPMLVPQFEQTLIAVLGAARSALVAFQ